MAGRTILHVDMDAFFVACEVRRDPALAGKPVIVGGDPRGRGVVASASYEARQFGIHSAMPAREAHRRCPQAIFLRGHFEDYVQTSRRLRTLFEEVTPVVEMASLDEAYLDLTGTERLWGAPIRVAERLRRRIAETEHLPCSMGLAATRGVAKIASDHAKPRGLLWVWPGHEAAFLAPMPVNRLRGVGPKTHERLRAWGIRTIGDLARLGAGPLTEAFGAMGEELHLAAIGQDRGEVHPNAERKSLGHETTFDTDIDDLDTALATLSRLAEDVASGLRRRGLAAHRVTLKVRQSDFQTFTRAHTFAAPTNLETELFHAAADLLRRAWKGGTRLRLLGISASGLIEDQPQLDLLADASRERLGALARAVDAIRRRHGAEAIRRASSAVLKEGGTLPPWETGGRGPAPPGGSQSD